MCLLYDKSTLRLAESGFMEKPGMEPVTPGLQDKGLSPTSRRPGMAASSVLERRLVQIYRSEQQLLDNNQQN